MNKLNLFEKVLIGATLIFCIYLVTGIDENTREVEACIIKNICTGK